MTITNGYATLDELKSAIDPAGSATWSGGDDLNLERAIEAASRVVDEYADKIGRGPFYGTTAARSYVARFADWLPIDDAISVTTVATDEDFDGVFETTWSATDYFTEPINGTPITAIRVKPNGLYSFPTSKSYAAVKVTANYGFAASAPTYVKAACLLIANRLWRRHDTIFGIAGTPSIGVTIVQAKLVADSDVEALLSALPARAVGAGGW